MSGHLFIVHGDLTTIACDAILIPTDEDFSFTAAWDSLSLERPAGGWQDRKAIPYSTLEGQPQIWLGNIGQPGDSSEFAKFEPAVREFVESAKLIDHKDERRIYPGPKIRVAVNVVGSGQGGARARKGELLLDLVPLLQTLVREHDVDIVLATYGDKPYAAAQRARRRLLINQANGTKLTPEVLQSEWSFDFSSDHLHAEADRLAKAAINSHLVLFIGAGVSAGAGIPTWKKLLSTIGAQAGIDPGYLQLLEDRDLRDWATLIGQKMRTNADTQATHSDVHLAAADVIQRHQRCSLQHALLASLPSTEAVTTNFDQLFEVASRVADRELAVLPDHPRENESGWLLKLHGSVEKPESMVLTRSDYLDMPRYHGALMGLVQGLLLTRHMLFVGYSLSDEDFHELIHEVRAARGESGAGRATMLTLQTNEVEMDLWANDLDIVAMSPIGTAIADSARQLEIFLDLVGFLSTTSAAFFLDETYRHLAADEASLLEALEDLRGITADGPEDSVAHKVHVFLRELGGASIPPVEKHT